MNKKIVVILVLVLIVAGAGYFVRVTQGSNQKTNEQIVKVVASSTALSSKPTIKTLTSSDVESQEVLQKNSAKKGDKLLTYKAEKKAVIYRTSTDKIIAIIDTEFGGKRGLLSKDRKVIILYDDGFKSKAEKWQRALIEDYNLSSNNIDIKPFEQSSQLKLFIAPITKDDTTSEDLIKVTETVNPPILAGDIPTVFVPSTSGYDFIIYIAQ